MATITGTKTGATCIYKESHAGFGTREVWQISADFGAYTASTDDADMLLVGAYIDGICRDGKTSTLRWGAPMQAGATAAGAHVYFTGATVQALTVSTDSLTGELNTAALVETDALTTGVSGVQILVGLDRA